MLCQQLLAHSWPCDKPITAPPKRKKQNWKKESWDNDKNPNRDDSNGLSTVKETYTVLR